MKINFSQITTQELAQELINRTDLVQPNGLLSPDVFTLRAKLGPIICTDGIPVRMHEGVLQGGLIRRNTGRYRGTLCNIGGTIGLGETIDAALRRHFHTDIGKNITFLDPLGVTQPIGVYQYYGEGLTKPFLPEPTKHAVALTYLVSIEDGNFIFGSSEYGQEASAFEWHSAPLCPTAEEFGYQMREVFLECLNQATKFFKN